MKTHFAYRPQINKLPRVLIYKKPKSSLYTMMTTDKPRIVGSMWAQPRKIDGKKFFEIILLVIDERRKGFGTEFIDFAKNISKQSDCEGRVFLTSDINIFESKIPPHIFYRKQGFTTNDKQYLKKIDQFIKEGKEMTYKDNKCIYMYYDPTEKKPFEKLKEIFKPKRK